MHVRKIRCSKQRSGAILSEILSNTTLAKAKLDAKYILKKEIKIGIR